MTVVDLFVPLRRIRQCAGIYDINGDGAKAEIPDRALWLAPAAAASFDEHLRDSVVVSDMFRSADSSLAALRAKRGAAAPGRSAHNYGRAIDIDVAATMERLGLKMKAQLDAWMSRRAWSCWRDDHALARESWHYYFTDDPAGAVYLRGSAVAWWGRVMARDFPLAFDVVRRQRALAETGFYGGALDGKAGPLTRLAIAAFGRAWGSSDDRTLAYVEWGRTRARELAKAA